LLKHVYTVEAPNPENDRDQQPLKPNANLARKEFQELWNRINLKTQYRVDLDTDKLITESALQLDLKLHLTARSYEVKTGELRATTKDQLLEGTGIYVTGTQKERLREELYAQTTYDLIGELESRTHLTRRTLVAILQRIKAETFLLLRRNPEEFIARSAMLINEAKAKLLINNITYHKTEDRFETKTIFANTGQALRSDEVLKKHIYDVLATDSKTERTFAKAMEEAAEVVVYAKLPKQFYIYTPHGRYSPDWAIVLDSQRMKHVYFVAETKGSDAAEDRREVENAKIHCAQKHFEAIGGPGVRYEVVSTFDKLLDIATLR
jgi:type III restriction enzyme